MINKHPLKCPIINIHDILFLNDWHIMTKLDVCHSMYHNMQLCSWKNKDQAWFLRDAVAIAKGAILCGISSFDGLYCP